MAGIQADEKDLWTDDKVFTSTPCKKRKLDNSFESSFFDTHDDDDSHAEKDSDYEPSYMEEDTSKETIR